MGTSNSEIIEEYLDALRKKDLDAAPFDVHIRFDNPVTGKGSGADNLRAFLSGFLPAIDEIRIHRHVCEGEYVVTHWEVDGVFGIIPILELFRVRDGLIVESTAFFDPRPILGS